MTVSVYAVAETVAQKMKRFGLGAFAALVVLAVAAFAVWYYLVKTATG